MIIKNTKEKNIQPEITKQFLKRKSVIIKNVTNNSISKLSFNKELLKNIKKTKSVTKNNVNALHKDNLIKPNNFIPTLRKTQSIGYRNVKLLKSFLTEYKKIKSRRLTKLTLKQQRQLSKSVKRARMLKLFDIRKTLKPRKFLNFDRKVETLQTLMIIKLLNLDALLSLIKTSETIKIKEILLFIDFLKYLNKKTYID
ncbi:unnamed protein product [Dictyota dichotoma]